MAAIDINPQFERVLALLGERRESVFITGKAGTGKSTLLEHFCQKSANKPVVLAPTGVAALNVKGQTIHSFFNFYIDVTPEKVRSKKIKPRSPQIYKAIKTIIIDEISMVRADIMDCIDEFLRLYGPSPEQPFGGVHMVLVGDLYQLPPVVNAEEMEIFSRLYSSPYFFSAKVFESFPLEIVELEKVYRQKDQEFVDLLNKIRNNSVDDHDIKKLATRYNPNFVPPAHDFYISLTTTNKRADEINEAHSKALVGRTYSFKASVTGEFGQEYFPTAPLLECKIGAQVMLLNNDSKKRYVNGSMGVIESIKTIDDEEHLGVRLTESDRLVYVARFMWEVIRFKIVEGVIVSEAVGTFTQFPLRLAWAVTIHKSQGKTFDKVILDVGPSTFAAGQIYVGLSRATSFEGIVLKSPIHRHLISSDPRIARFMTSYYYKKSQVLCSHEQKISLIKEAIRLNKNLKMIYLKANDTKFERVIAPKTVGTHNYQGKLFPALVAFCLSTNQEQIFHVGRILELHHESS